MENNWLGQIQIKVDEKGRFSLPASSLSMFEDKQLVLAASVYKKKPFLEIISSKTWVKRLEVLNRLPEKDSKAKAFKRFVIGGSSKLSLDKQNRVTIPGFQRSYLKLEKEAIIVNIDNKIELWSKELWNEIQESFMESFEDLSEWVDEFDFNEGEQKQEQEQEGKSYDVKSAA